MYQSIVDIVNLTTARVRSSFEWEQRGLVDAHDPVHRATLESSLDRHASLAGQTHALSRDRWKLLVTRDGTVVPLHERPFTLIVWRDPIGPSDTFEDALAQLRAHAARVGKHVIVLGASDRCRAIAEDLGYSATFVGSEQVFDLARFGTRGRAGEKLRLAVNHARRGGARACELFPREDAVAREHIAAVERLWKGARPERQTESFLRTEPMENAWMRRYFGVYRGSELEAFLVCAPVSRRGFYLQDLVRLPTAVRGAAELVSLAALETFAREGLEKATMGIVPFYTPAGTRRPLGLSAASAFCVRHFDRAFRFSGLQQFRAKFPATDHISVYALIWPRVLNPLCAWDVVQLLGRGSE